MQPDAREIHALNRLRLQETDYVQFLRKSRDHIYNRMIGTANTEELHALRGEARCLSELIELIEGSRDASERLEANRK